MRLRRIADGVCARIDHELQQHAAIEARTADQEVVGRPFATFVLSPGLSQPFAVRFEATGSEHTRTCLEALRAAARRNEPTAIQFDGVDRRFIADAHAKLFCAAVVGVDQRFAAAHEEGVGAGNMQRA